MLDEGVESCSDGIHQIHWRRIDSDGEVHVLFEGLRAKRAYIEFWPIFIFCRIELIFGRLTCFDLKSIVL